jgi:hypothetical protein
MVTSHCTIVPMTVTAIAAAMTVSASTTHSAMAHLSVHLSYEILLPKV